MYTEARCKHYEFLPPAVTWEWMRVDFPKGGSLCRSGHSVCVSNAGDLGTGAVVFGGIDADGVKTAATMFLPVTLPPSLC